MRNSDRGSKVAGRQNGRKVCMFQRTISPPAAPDFIIKRHRDAMFRPQKLALAVIDITFVNNNYVSHFLGRFRNLRALRTNPIYPILHNQQALRSPLMVDGACKISSINQSIISFRISRRGMKTCTSCSCTSEKPDLSLTSSLHRQSR